MTAFGSRSHTSAAVPGTRAIARNSSTNPVGPLSAAHARLTETFNADFQQVAAAAAAQHMLAGILPATAIQSALAAARRSAS